MRLEFSIVEFGRINSHRAAWDFFRFKADRMEVIEAPLPARPPLRDRSSAGGSTQQLGAFGIGKPLHSGWFAV